MACGCPQGTTLVTLPDGTSVCRQDTSYNAWGNAGNSLSYQLKAEVITGAVNPNTNPKFYKKPDNSKYGANFYNNISTYQLPVTLNTDYATIRDWKDTSNTVVPLITNVSNSVWGTGTGGNIGPWDGRMNDAAVADNYLSPYGTWGGTEGLARGFSVCLVVPTTAVYSIGFGGQLTQVWLDGKLIIDNLTADNWGYEMWNVIPITLYPGSYIFEVRGGNVTPGLPTTTYSTLPGIGAPPGIAFEIYKADTATLMAIPNTAALALLTEYSTANENGKLFDWAPGVNLPLGGPGTNNYRCNFGDALDNCFTSDEAIYICHHYTDTPAPPCCYLLTNCENSQEVYLTSTDLSVYVGQVIKVSEYVGCFQVSLAPDCGPALPPPVTFVQAFVDCVACLPQCYLLQDCDGLVADILTNTDLSTYVGAVINIQGSTTCWEVLTTTGCQGSIAIVLTAAFADCTECKPVFYLLINCQNPSDIRVTPDDLSAYVNKVVLIKGCPDVCWQVSVSPSCDLTSDTIPVVIDQEFVDCDKCLNIPPPPPVLLRNRSVKPGYNTPGCDPAYTEKVSCNFANAAYDEMVITRYGITMCCNEPIEKWEIKKQLLDLRAIYDPELCKTVECCPPCAMVATLTVYSPIFNCIAPTNMIADLEIPPSQCPAPTNMQAGIGIP